MAPQGPLCLVFRPRAALFQTVCEIGQKLLLAGDDAGQFEDPFLDQRVIDLFEKAPGAGDEAGAAGLVFAA